MRTTMTLIRKELGQQAKWLAVWFAAAHFKVALALLGFGMLWLTGEPVPGGESVNLKEDAFLAMAFMMPRSDTSILTFLGIGFFFFWGGFRIFQQEAQQRSVVWLRTMPVPDSRDAIAKLIVAGGYAWLVLVPAVAVFLATPGPWVGPGHRYSDYVYWVAGQYFVVWTVYLSFIVVGALAGTLAATGGWAGFGSTRRSHLKFLLGFGVVWIAAFVGFAVLLVVLQAAVGFDAVMWLYVYAGGGPFLKSLPVLAAHAALSAICGAWLVRRWTRRPAVA